MTTERQVRQKYSEEFKRGSTALVAEQDYIISKTARRVNVNANLLVKWRDRLAKESTGRRSTRDEREQLKRPCKVNRLPTMEQEILKNSQYLMMEMRCSPLPFARMPLAGVRSSANNGCNCASGLEQQLDLR